jgi:hypothetical protein
MRPGVTSRRPAVVAALGLIAATAVAYHGVFRLGFVFDDLSYVVDNRDLQAGFSLQSLWWALTSTHAANWHPLTWLSHMLDVRLFGLAPAGHHGMNLLLHLAAALLLLRAGWLFTGRLWPSATVAAIFALHPLHVETVAWVAERKDLLCAVFWMLTLLAYRRYCARPGPGRYGLILAAFLPALMSKPMAVTLPCVLLLLDYWPLGRLREQPLLSRALRLCGEKLPLFMLSAAASVITLHAQRSGGAIYNVAAYGFPSRAANAIVSIAAYFGKTFWPHPLAIHYPIPAAGHPLWQIALGVLLLAGCTAVAVALRRRLPFLAVGWLWFIGTLVPVLGLVQVGMQAMADRYTYLPLVGLSLALVWAGSELRPRRHGARVAIAIFITGVLILLGVRTEAQVRVWRDNVTLYSNAVESTRDNWVMHYFLAIALTRLGRLEDAAAQYQETVRLQPLHAEAHAALADVLVRLGRFDAAAAHYRQTIRLKPLNAAAHKGLGAALEAEGRVDEAIAAYREAVRLEPGNGFFRALLERALARRAQLPGRAVWPSGGNR